MLLNADYITPAELTGYVREALADLEVNRFRLGRYLPNNPVDDLAYRFTRGGEGLTEAATFRAYDTESPIGSRPGATRVTGELPPISRKIRLGEYDRLRQRRADSPAVVDGLLTDAVRMTRAVAARVEMARGEALATGKVVIAENGLTATVDFGRKPGHTVTAAVPWSTAATAVPLSDLISWRDTYVDSVGVDPGVLLISRKALSYALRTDEVTALVATIAGTPSIAAQAAFEAVLAAHGLPPIEVIDEKVSVAGAATRVVPEDVAIFLPAPGNVDDPDSTDLGATVWGTTAESLSPDFGVEDGDYPGIVAGAYATADPVALWTKASGIALPVLANPDLSFAAEVY